MPSPVKDPETASVYRHESSTGRCLLTLLGLAFILTGLIVGGACVYRYFAPKVMTGMCPFINTNQPIQSFRSGLIGIPTSF